MFPEPAPETKLGVGMNAYWTYSWNLTRSRGEFILNILLKLRSRDEFSLYQITKQMCFVKFRILNLRMVSSECVYSRQRISEPWNDNRHNLSRSTLPPPPPPPPPTLVIVRSKGLIGLALALKPNNNFIFKMLTDFLTNVWWLNFFHASFPVIDLEGKR